ncbi:hypothetical protein [Ammoniphilus resinae]|uniref:Uncharacterized protein n=1 Tax=Ammoniphilus resinae TaxID=861532 RepID=A0ABS4GSG7_9BACL|nr:hypothetical protein [Ammoniphilus resinae]MBP1933230.1 hypothetical protein [Ammoniphilus resinae]
MSNEEILTLLRTVIQEELNPIKMELQDSRAQMISRFDMLEAKLSGVEDVVATIESSVKRLEVNEPGDVMGMLKQLNLKLEENHGLSSKIDELETDMKIIKKVISNQ